jgi:hypothetical protein
MSLLLVGVVALTGDPFRRAFVEDRIARAALNKGLGLGV